MAAKTKTKKARLTNAARLNAAFAATRDLRAAKAAAAAQAGIPVDKGRIDLAMEAVGQMEVLTKQILNYIDKAREMERSEAETIMRALASRCSSLAGSAYTLLADDNCVRREDIEKIERMVGHG